MQHSDRSLFWIEPTALTALLERLEADPPARVEPAQAEPDAEEGGIRTVFANKQSERPDSTAPHASIEDFRVPEGPLESRLEALLAWLADLSAFDQAFVADVEGLALVDRGARPELVAAAAAVGERWAEMQGALGLPPGPSLTIDLEGDEKLYLLLAESRWGRLNLGFVTCRALERPVLERAAAAFGRAVDEQGEIPS